MSTKLDDDAAQTDRDPIEPAANVSDAVRLDANVLDGLDGRFHLGDVFGRRRDLRAHRRDVGPPVTNIRNVKPPHWKRWLKPESRTHPTGAVLSEAL
ncbi:hypothetical protein [Bradyrhizobium sp. USDA 3256]